MGLLANLFNKLQENDVRNRIRSLYSSLTSTVSKLEEEYPNLENPADYFKMALEKRSHWQKTSERTFQYHRYGETKTLNLEEGDTTLELIKRVVTVEIQVAGNRLNSEQKEKLVTAGLAELEKLANLA